MRPLADCRLYAFVDSAYLHGRAPVEVAGALCGSGADLIQYRAKGQSPEAVRKTALQLLPITRDAGVGLVINDHWGIACDVGAPLCHLGQEDFFGAGFCRKADLGSGGRIRQMSGQSGLAPGGKRVSRSEGDAGDRNVAIPSAVERGAAGPDALRAPGNLPLLGLSSHAPEQALRAIDAGADYVAVGPVFPTGTKPGRPAVTLEYVRWAAANISIPWFAIGGITLGNLDSVLDAGATRICVVSAILNPPDVARACAEFRRRLDERS